jgi:hypothetical protein
MNGNTSNIYTSNGQPHRTNVAEWDRKMAREKIAKRAQEAAARANKFRS